MASLTWVPQTQSWQAFTHHKRVGPALLTQSYLTKDLRCQTSPTQAGPDPATQGLGRCWAHRPQSRKQGKQVKNVYICNEIDTVKNRTRQGRRLSRSSQLESWECTAIPPAELLESGGQLASSMCWQPVRGGGKVARHARTISCSGRRRPSGMTVVELLPPTSSAKAEPLDGSACLNVELGLGGRPSWVKVRCERKRRRGKGRLLGSLAGWGGRAPGAPG